MNAQTITALEAEIAMWERAAAGEQIDIRPEASELCRLFYRHCCETCPVYTRTDQIECELTHINDYESAVQRNDTEAAKRWAQKQVDLLADIRSNE